MIITLCEYLRTQITNQTKSENVTGKTNYYKEERTKKITPTIIVVRSRRFYYMHSNKYIQTYRSTS